MHLVPPWETALSTCAITASPQPALSHHDARNTTDFCTSADSYPSEELPEAIEAWVERLDIAIRHIENLISQDQLMEADRALFLASERFGWHQALGYLQQRLDDHHRKTKDSRIASWILKAETAQLEGRLEDALELLERAVALAPTDDETRRELEELIDTVHQEQAERLRSQLMLSGSGQSWSLEFDDERVAALRSINERITEGRLDEAAMDLEIAIDQWGMDEEWNALYLRIVQQRTGESASRETDRAANLLADLLVQATLAFEAEDRFKARLLVAEALRHQPDHQTALDLARRLDS